VIITNPTHYSVALHYERGMSAPVCVVKGADNIALKIREIARSHDIPIVENVRLARALHATVEVDHEIPVEHYHAVAEIIGYVMGLSAQPRRPAAVMAGGNLRSRTALRACAWPPDSDTWEQAQDSRQF
jgi:flagellar biosynthesis protein FlhB